jgi:pimeloyl-ACP methyl ester carboxylesterase
MADSTSIKTRSGLTFTADVAGPIDGPLVLLLHGFPESRHSWRAALPSLAAAGYRAVAPDQRGYSADARPDPADLSNYAFDKLVNDAIEVVAAAGHDGRRFHLVGHD